MKQALGQQQACGDEGDESRTVNIGWSAWVFDMW